MQRREIGARRRGDDGDGVDLLAVRPDPGFRERGECNRLAIAAMDEEWPLARAGIAAIRSSRRPESGSAAA